MIIIIVFICSFWLMTIPACITKLHPRLSKVLLDRVHSIKTTSHEKAFDVYRIDGD